MDKRAKNILHANGLARILVSVCAALLFPVFDPVTFMCVVDIREIISTAFLSPICILFFFAFPT